MPMDAFTLGWLAPHLRGENIFYILTTENDTTMMFKQKMFDAFLF